MAVIPKESIFASQSIKPSSFVVWCLLCQVKDKRQKDVYLDAEKAQKAGIKKSAYYHAFSELKSKGWITPSGSKNGQKRWSLIKGFSANVENEDGEDSANTENNSANVESFSANVESHNKEVNQPNKQTKQTKPKIVSDKPKPVDPPELISFRKTLSTFQDAYAKPTTKGQIIAQQTAIRQLFHLARGDALACIERHRFYQTEDWRKGRINWSLVVKEFNYYGKNGVQNGNNQRTNGQYQSTAEKRLKDEIESEQLIRDLLSEAEQEGVSGEHYRAIEAHSPSC